MKVVQAKNVEEYINSFPPAIKKLLQQVRATVKAAAPKSDEMIAYGMPGYKLYDKPLVYFGGYEHHIGFYATPTGHKEFEKELSKYKQGKGSVQFPINEPLPLKLISAIVKFRVSESDVKYGSKKLVKKAPKKAAKKATKKK